MIEVVSIAKTWHIYCQLTSLQEYKVVKILGVIKLLRIHEYRV